METGGELANKRWAMPMLDEKVQIREHYEPAFSIVSTYSGKRISIKKLSLISIFYQNFANRPWKNMMFH